MKKSTMTPPQPAEADHGLVGRIGDLLETARLGSARAVSGFVLEEAAINRNP